MIGSSSGYGLAATSPGWRATASTGSAISFEKDATARRTATAGWYRTASHAAYAESVGSNFTFVNADAFADTTKNEVLDLMQEKFGGVDYLIYSVAAPRRIDPRTDDDVPVGLKTIGQPCPDQEPRVRRRPAGPAEVGIDVATDDEVARPSR